MWNGIWRDAFYFGLFFCANVIFYEILFFMSDFYKNDAVNKFLLGNKTSIMVFAMIMFASVYFFLMGFADFAEARGWASAGFKQHFQYVLLLSLLTLPFSFVAGATFNYSYAAQGDIHDGNLVVVQMLVWLSAPAAYTVLTILQRGESLNKYTWGAILLIFIANILARLK